MATPLENAIMNTFKTTFPQGTSIKRLTETVHAKYLYERGVIGSSLARLQKRGNVEFNGRGEVMPKRYWM